MRIAETFVSLQGEGRLAGTPSFFVRTSGCNLRCAWCDTPYASWEPEGEERSVAWLVAAAVDSGLSHAVVTGGEPLVQRAIGTLCRTLRGAGLHLTVETAGTVAPEFECDLLSVSPKTSNSDPGGRWRHRHVALRSDHDALVELLARHRDHQLKFVVRDESDMGEIELLVRELGVVRERVLLMPEGRTPDEVARRAPLVAALCLRGGYRYSPRLQMDLFGGGRGV